MLMAIEHFAGKDIPFSAITIDWLNRSEERQTDIRAENDRSFSVFGGLFSPSNVRDEQPFIPPKKKKKKKRGYRL